GGWEANVEATSLPTLLQMVEGGLGVTLLPEIALEAGMLNGSRLTARPFAAPAPSRTIAPAVRRTSPRWDDAELLAELFVEQRRAARPGLPAPRRASPLRRPRPGSACRTGCGSRAPSGIRRESSPRSPSSPSPGPRPPPGPSPTPCDHAG